MIPIIPYTVTPEGLVQKNGGNAICPFQTKFLVSRPGALSGNNAPTPTNSTCTIFCPMCNLVTHKNEGEADVFGDGAYLEISCSGTVGYYKIGELEEKGNKSTNLKSVK